MKTSGIVVLCVVVLGLFGVVVFGMTKINKNTEPNPIVEKTGNGNDNNTSTGTGYVAGHVSIGPICPVESVEHPCVVPPEVYTSRQVIVYKSNGTTIKERVNLDTEGNYKITLNAGTYFLQIEPAGIGPGEKKKVIVKSLITSTVDFDIDTGIR